MNKIKGIWLLLLLVVVASTSAQTVTIKSPDSNIVVTISNEAKLLWSVIYKGKSVVDTSQLGFEFKNEQPLTGNFEIIEQSIKNFKEKWNYPWSLKISIWLLIHCIMKRNLSIIKV